MTNIKTSKHFRKFTDPVSGVESYVLNTKVAAAQQGFYFVNSAMDDGARYLWFYCFFPPAMYHVLGVVDFEDDEVRCFPETQFMGGPLVDLESGECIYASNRALYKKSPKPNTPPVKICDLPRELTSNGLLLSVATHLTYSPDKTELFLDSRVCDRFLEGSIELATGKYTLWREFDCCKNHAQFHPKNKNLALIAEDFWNETLTGKQHVIRYNEKGEFMRLWTLTRDGVATLYPPLNGERATHEWWSADGDILFYCKYLNETLHTSSGDCQNNGITGINIYTGEHKVYAPVPAWHGSSSLDNSFFTYDANDIFYRGTPSRVGFYDAATQKQVYIVSQNPALAPREQPSPYHLDPHPRLMCRDKYIGYTIAQNGYTEVAVCETEQLLNRTR